MRYSTLIAGSQQSAIDEFFVRMNDKFECITTSGRSKDIIRHLRLLDPELFVICLKDDEKELARVIAQIEPELRKMDIVIALLGDKENLDIFNGYSGNLADLMLEKPLTNKAIMDKIDDFFDNRNKQRELERLKAEEELKKYNKKHILIVDDDPNMLKLIKSYLEPEYDVATAINGSVALRFLTKKTTDLILLDYEMPGQSGDSVLSILRGSATTRDIPVIFLTGVSDTSKIAKVLALRPQGYLLKPVDRAKLSVEIKKVFGD